METNTNSEAQKMMLYMDQKKSVAVAYILLIFFGGLGVHRFYLGSIKMGILILVLTLAGMGLIPVYGLGLIILAIPGLICLIDLFLIPSLTRKKNFRIMLNLNIDATKNVAAV